MNLIDDMDSPEAEVAALQIAFQNIKAMLHRLIRIKHAGGVDTEQLQEMAKAKEQELSTVHSQRDELYQQFLKEQEEKRKVQEQLFLKEQEEKRKAQEEKRKAQEEKRKAQVEKRRAQEEKRKAQEEKRKAQEAEDRARKAQREAEEQARVAHEAEEEYREKLRYSLIVSVLLFIIVLAILYNWWPFYRQREKKQDNSDTYIYMHELN